MNAVLIIIIIIKVMIISIIIRIPSVLYKLTQAGLDSSPGVAPVVKNPPANAGDGRDVGLIPGLGQSPGVENGNRSHLHKLQVSSSGITNNVKLCIH